MVAVKLNFDDASGGGFILKLLVESLIPCGPSCSNLIVQTAPRLAGAWPVAIFAFQRPLTHKHLNSSYSIRSICSNLSVHIQPQSVQ